MAESQSEASTEVTKSQNEDPPQSETKLPGQETPGSAVDAELEWLQSQFKEHCRVIHDVGDFAHVVEVKLTQPEMTIKFQLEGSYPTSTPGCIVRSPALSPRDQSDLTLHLNSEMTSLQGKAVMQAVIDKAKTWMASVIIENDEAASTKEAAPPKSQREKGRHNQRTQNRKGKKKAKADPASEDDTKLPPMKTAEQVISRIMWDDVLPTEEFIIGYIDRFIGLQEKNFTAFSWEDIASVDYSTLAIPKHRIQYFKFRKAKIWDKTIRMDNVFGSTGSKTTIYDVIAKYKDEDYDKTDNDDPDAGAANGAAVGCSQSDSDDDDIEINLGEAIEGPGQEQQGGYKRDQYWGEKKRPTHFLCLRVKNPAVKSQMEKAHKTIERINPDYCRHDSCLLPPERLHVTLACLGLDTQDDIDRAVAVLERLHPELNEWSPSAMTMHLNGVDNFFNQTLYAPVTCDPKVLAFVEHLRKSLASEGVDIRDLFDFTPHMTIMKLKKHVQAQLHTRYLDPRLYTDLAGIAWGSQNMDGLYLCDMGSEQREEDGFYISHCKLTFGAESNADNKQQVAT